MPRLGLWIFICVLPLAAALGHDIYLAYSSPKGFDFTQPFPFSEAGWVWERYSYDSWKWAKDAFDPVTWQKFIAPVLNRKTILVAAVPIVLLASILIFCKLFGLGPFAGNGLLLGRIPRYSSGNNTKLEKHKAKVRYKRR